MHTVEMLEQALDLAARLGYTIRQEWLAGSGGGGCELKGRKLFFLDLDWPRTSNSNRCSKPSAASPTPPAFPCRTNCQSG